MGFRPQEGLTASCHYIISEFRVLSAVEYMNESLHIKVKDVFYFAGKSLTWIKIYRDDSDAV